MVQNSVQILVKITTFQQWAFIETPCFNVQGIIDKVKLLFFNNISIKLKLKVRQTLKIFKEKPGTIIPLNTNLLNYHLKVKESQRKKQVHRFITIFMYYFHLPKLIF